MLIVLSADVGDLIVTEWCCYGLYILSIHGSCPVELLQRDILPCLLRLCEVQSERIRYFCAGALACISQIADLDSSSAIATAVKMMSSEKNPSELKHFVTSIRSAMNYTYAVPVSGVISISPVFMY